jgi:hypothetical protein
VFDYGFALRSSAMLGRGGRWKVPFYKGCACYKWDVVEVDYLVASISCAVAGSQVRTLSVSSNFGFEMCQSVNSYIPLLDLHIPFEPWILRGERACLVEVLCMKVKVGGIELTQWIHCPNRTPNTGNGDPNASRENASIVSQCIITVSSSCCRSLPRGKFGCKAKNDVG